MRLKLLISRCLLTSLAAVVSHSAFAFEIDGINYQINSSTDKTVSVFNLLSGNYSGDIIIPSQVRYNDNDYTVNGINGSAFAKCTELNSVVIPESVTTIGDAVFNGCTNLKSVNIPSNLTEIPRWMFMDCTALTSITLPAGLKSIGYASFNGCTALSSIKLPENLTEIGGHAFSGCTSLPDIIIPETVTTIGTSAFQNCKSITKINLPKDLTTIEEFTFNGCSELTEITIPEKVSSIGIQAFAYCYKLATIRLHPTTPPVAYEAEESKYGTGTFSSYNYTHTDLIVPYESIEDYKTAHVWENFFQDRWPLTGIEDVEAEGGKAIVGRYDLSGRPVAEDYRGVVIVRYADGTTSKEVRR